MFAPVKVRAPAIAAAPARAIAAIRAAAAASAGAAALIALVALVAAVPALGQSGRAADPAAIKAKAQVCEACHGPQGNPVDPAIPALAGQPKQFITTQLVMYREGRRVNDVMSAIARDMPNPDINDYGTYFSAQKRVVTASAVAADKTAAGRVIAERFNCVQCHGPTLMGQQHIPRVAGQQSEYLRAQLKGFKAGTRFDMDGNMTAAAQPLTAADIDQLSEYLSSLQ